MAMFLTAEEGPVASRHDAVAEQATLEYVIGMDKEEPLRRFTTRMRSGRFEPATGEATLCGVFVETDDATGLATRCEPIRLGGQLAECLPG